MDFRNILETERTLRRLINLGNKGLQIVFDDGVSVVTQGKVKKDEFLYRSIIYTLFFSNFHSAKWILNFERRIKNVSFPYPDVELVLRAMFERFIYQNFIMTDPNRLASLFIEWRIIEYKRYYQALEKAISENPDSIAAIMEGGKKIKPWSSKQEDEYVRAVENWEALVIPKQSAEKSRSWSGLSMHKMAEQTDLSDFYKIYYRATSWYAHSLVHVSDFYLHYDEETKVAKYHSNPTNDQVRKCLFEATIIYNLSLSFTSKVLGWEMDKKVDNIFDEKFGIPQFIGEIFAFLYELF